MHPAALLVVAAALCSNLQSGGSGGAPEVGLATAEGARKFEQFAAEHSRVYASLADRDVRQAVFLANLAFINAHNANATAGWTLGVGPFADKTNAEFRRTFSASISTGTAGQPGDLPPATRLAGKSAAPPASIDWQAKKMVSLVKNQGQCGGCWSFAAAEAVESAWAIAGNDLVSLSEQQLLDCATESNKGCKGGTPQAALDYVLKNGGLNSEDDYHYTGQQAASCDSARQARHVAGITKRYDVPANDGAALLAAVAGQPVAVAIEANTPHFQHYKAGVLAAASCGVKIDHAVLAVGYGTEAAGPYWRLKNSWGAEWGEAGYVRLARSSGGGEGTCGINLQPTYCTAAKHSGPGPGPPTPGPQPPPMPPQPPPIQPIPRQNSTQCMAFSLDLPSGAAAHKMTGLLRPSNTTRIALGGAAATLGLSLAFFGVVAVKVLLFVAGATAAGWVGMQALLNALGFVPHAATLAPAELCEIITGGVVVLALAGGLMAATMVPVAIALLGCAAGGGLGWALWFGLAWPIGSAAVNAWILAHAGHDLGWFVFIGLCGLGGGMAAHQHHDAVVILVSSLAGGLLTGKAMDLLQGMAGGEPARLSPTPDFFRRASDDRVLQQELYLAAAVAGIGFVVQCFLHRRKRKRALERALAARRFRAAALVVPVVQVDGRWAGGRSISAAGTSLQHAGSAPTWEVLERARLEKALEQSQLEQALAASMQGKEGRRGNLQERLL